MKLAEGIRNVVSRVVRSNLCTGCGTCSAICPKNAIQMVIEEKRGIYVPRVDENRCIGCQICLKVCPGYEVDFVGLNSVLFDNMPNDDLVGNCIKCYSGYSCDQNIRYNSSSGGLITSILIYLLENKIITGALVTKMNKDFPLEPQPFIARTREDIIEASGSKYCPVPGNYALREILQSNKADRFAVVGLPCHIHGIRKAQQINTVLKDRIVLCIGLFCGAYSTFRGMDFLIEKINAKKNNIKKLRFRGAGWPGNLILVNNQDEVTQISYPLYSSYLDASFFPLRCTLCIDATNEFSDMSFGDAWLPEFLDDSLGTSIFICRSTNSVALLEKMVCSGVLRADPISIAKLKASQMGLIRFKKLSYRSHSNICKYIFRIRPPLYNGYFRRNSPIIDIRSVYMYNLIILSRCKASQNISDNIKKLSRFISKYHK